MSRIKEIVEDLRPILSDRLNAVTSAGYYIGELLDELESMDKKTLIEKAKDKINELTGTAGTNRTDVIENEGTSEEDNSSPIIEGGLRKSNAAQRHAEKIARGELG